MRIPPLMCLLMLTAVPAFACVKDADCTGSNTCQFSAAVAEGQCLDPTPPAVARGERPYAAPLSTRKAGDTCQFSVDCAVDMHCYKAAGATEGKCFPLAR